MFDCTINDKYGVMFLRTIHIQPGNKALDYKLNNIWNEPTVYAMKMKFMFNVISLALNFYSKIQSSKYENMELYLYRFPHLLQP